MNLPAQPTDPTDNARPDKEARCRHCGDPIRQGESGDWAHIMGPGSVLYNCQHTVPYGQVAEPDETRMVIPPNVAGPGRMA